MSGLFITIEGVEGSGKSTQTRLLAEFLRARDHRVVITREPGGVPLAERIRDLLLEPDDETIAPLAELLLYQAARAQHVNKVILPALDRGDIVLCDRYVDSTSAYQGAGRQIAPEIIGRLNRLAASGAWPDSTFLLDLPAEAGLQRARERGSVDRMMGETLAFHQRIRDGFLQLAQEEPNRITIIDASQSVDAIQAELQRQVRRRLEERCAPK